MNLQTTVPAALNPAPVNYDSHVLLMGSCFTTNIGEKLEYFRFSHLLNPFGIQYQPLGICRHVSRAITEDFYSEEDVFLHNGAWHCFEAHSEMNQPGEAAMVEALNTALASTRQALLKATHLLITPGTSWVYRHKGRNLLVSNCHKLPQAEFDKELLPVSEIVDAFRMLFEQLRAFNNQLQLIVTLSPVRHIRDGFMGNQRSKAHLVSAIHTLLDEIEDRKKLYYFPAYEIQLDELRDYRFYDRDLIHPNPLAVDYIWEKFRQACIGDSAYPVMKEVDVIQRGLQHRPFSPDSEAHRKFKKALKVKMDNLNKRYPSIKF